MRLLRRGQSLVEFAFILPVLLLVFFAIIDGAFIVQGILTVNYAARQAARFAIVYQPPIGECLTTYRGKPVTKSGYPYCGSNNESQDAYYDRRVALIKAIAQDEARGLRMFVMCDVDACFEQDVPGIFGTRVGGLMSFSDTEVTWDKPGLPGLPVQVQVIHHVPLVMFSMLSTDAYFRVVGTSEMVNEGIQSGQAAVPPPVAGPAVPPSPPEKPSEEPTPPTPEGSETPSETPPVGEMALTLNFETATNLLPDKREHLVIAHVTLDGQNVSNTPVAFSIDNGSFDASGSELFHSKMVNTDVNGRARVYIYANAPMVTHLEAWADGNLNSIKEASEWDKAVKTWVTNGPYLVVSNHNPVAGDFIGTLIKDHEPLESPAAYALWWCTDATEPATIPIDFQVASGIVVDPVSWSAEITDIEVPENAAGTYHMETHKETGGCGAGDLVARSGVITIKSVPPDLTITEVKILNPPENKRAPGVPMTVTVAIQNTQPVSVTGGPFDVDIYAHFDEAPGLREMGTEKEWQTLGPGETKVITFVVKVEQLRVNKLWAQVDTTNYIAETNELNNVFGPVTFDVCPHSDDFDAGLESFWHETAVGSAVATHSVDSNGQLAINNRSGELYWRDSNTGFYYIYQNYTGDFDARLRLVQRPSKTVNSKIGLLVTAGLNKNSEYLLSMINGKANPAGAHSVHNSTRVENPDAATTYPFWGRIVRQGTQYTFFRSAATEPTESDWVAVGSVNETTAFPYIGVAHANYNTSSASTGIVDDFVLCPVVFETPSVTSEEAPPGLMQCEEILNVPSFEGNNDTVFAYWRAGETGAFRRTSEQRYQGNFAMRLHASLGSYPCADSNLDPYLYQDVQIPATEIYSITTLVVTGHYLVTGSNLQCSTGASDPLDKLTLELQVPDAANVGEPGTRIVDPQEVTTGGGVTGTWRTIPITLSDSINLADYSGQTLRLYWDGYHNGNFDGTFFYVDDVSAQVCTTWPIPAPIPGTVSFGGKLTTQATGTGIRIPLTGASVWAYTQAGDMYQTTSIHDGTYHFYNLPEPGTYVVYAEAVVEGELRTAVSSVTLEPNDRKYNINMFLQ